MLAIQYIWDSKNSIEKITKLKDVIDSNREFLKQEITTANT